MKKEIKDIVGIKTNSIEMATSELSTQDFTRTLDELIAEVEKTFEHFPLEASLEKPKKDQFDVEVSTNGDIKIEILRVRNDISFKFNTVIPLSTIIRKLVYSCVGTMPFLIQHC